MMKPDRILGYQETYDVVVLCPRCKEGVYVFSNYCSHCGYEMEWSNINELYDQWFEEMERARKAVEDSTNKRKKLKSDSNSIRDLKGGKND